MTDTRDTLLIGRTSDGRLVRRPLSPHLGIYKPQISTTLSIFHRATGIALSVGTLLMVWWLVSASVSDAAYASVTGFIRSPIGILLMIGWTISLCYHFLAGLRHLAWDAGYGYSLEEYRMTGIAVLIGTAVLVVLVWVVGLAVWL